MNINFKSISIPASTSPSEPLYTQFLLSQRALAHLIIAFPTNDLTLGVRISARDNTIPETDKWLRYAGGYALELPLDCELAAIGPPYHLGVLAYNTGAAVAEIQLCAITREIPRIEYQIAEALNDLDHQIAVLAQAVNKLRGQHGRD